MLIKHITLQSRALGCKYFDQGKFFCTILTKQIEHSKGEQLPEKLEQKNIPSMNFKYERQRFLYPEFLPNPDVKRRNFIREKLERKDMLKRRSAIHLPYFFVGSIVAVTSSNKHSPGKPVRFVGICIYKTDAGLQSSFILRNVIEHTGVEVKYNLYSPLIQSIEVIRLEKRLDDELFYLRDAPNEYSTFSFDIAKEYYSESDEVPINTIKVKLNPRPWLQRYERMNLKGVILPELPEKVLRKAKLNEKPWEKYDLMDEYRKTIPQEEMEEIYSEIHDDLKKLRLKVESGKRKKEFEKPSKQKLF